MKKLCNMSWNRQISDESGFGGSNLIALAARNYTDVVKATMRLTLKLIKRVALSLQDIQRLNRTFKSLSCEYQDIVKHALCLNLCKFMHTM